MKKLLISILLSLYLFSLSLSFAVPSAKAASSWYDQSFDEWFTKVYDDSNPTEIFGERYTAAQVQWILYSFASLPFTNAKDLVNCSITHEATKCLEAIKQLITSIEDSKLYALQREAPKRTIVQNIIGDDRPLSGITYVKTQLRKFHLIPEAKAQAGFGFNALGPIQPLWRWFRNIAFLFFIIMTIAMAFMIMFRVKISPQIVITIQSALPKILITLILVTFSYAIAGFMVDLMYVVIGLIASLGRITGWDWLDTQVLWTFFNGSSVGITVYMVLYLMLFLMALIVGFFYWMWAGIANLLAGAFILPLLPFILILVAFLFFVILIWIQIKILWMLIKTVANIFILVIFSPLQIAFGAISSQTGFGSWLKSLVANLAVFPVTGFLFLIAFYFVALAILIALKGIIEENFMVTLAQFIFGLFGASFDISVILPGSIWNPPLMGDEFASILFLGVSFAILTMTAKAADLIKSMIEGKPFAYGTAIGETVGLPTTLGRGALATYAGKVEGHAATFGLPPPGWVSALRTVGIIKK